MCDYLSKISKLLPGPVSVSAAFHALREKKSILTSQLIDAFAIDLGVESAKDNQKSRRL